MAEDKAKIKILVVEDEGIVAQDIKSSLEGMGYEVPAIAFTGEEAIAKAEEIRPSLVLMDIMLKGDMDGIEAAEQIHSRFGIPSIYLTAYADEEMLNRAKITESYGYILKPYVDRELRSNIEIALYRIETDRELRQSEEKYRAVFENTGTATVVIGEDTMIVLVNHEMEILSGYSREELEGKKRWTEFVVSEDLETMQAYHDSRRTTPSSAPREYEFRFVDKQENVKDIWLTIAMIPGTKRSLASLMDITERKKAEKELKRRAYLLDSVTDAIVLRGKDGRTLYANRAAYVNRGYSKEEFMKLRPEDFMLSDEARILQQRFLELEDKEHNIYHYEVFSKDGTAIPLETNAQLVEIDREQYLLTVSRDITERKQAEEELKLRAEMLDQASDAIMLQEIGGKFSYANKTALIQRGYTLEQFLKLTPYDIASPEYANEVAEHDKQVSAKGQMNWEQWVHCHDGLLLPVEAKATLVIFRGKEYMLIIARDITDRKKAEEERAEIERKAQVASRLALVGEMASGIAHEINNPLTGVVGFAQLLAGREDLPEDVREELKVIHEGGERVSNIVQGLLSFARQSKPKRTYLDINEVIEGTLLLRQYELKTSSIELIKRFDPELPWTMADAGQLQQVFINLVVNAEHEMRKAHGKGRLEVKAELAGDMIRISFKDDGPGIAKENLDKLFDPFFTTKEVGQGTGLGLSLSHGIIMEHGGELYAESKPGKGATFVVELPVLAEEEMVEIKEAETGAETEEVVKGRILVVDDEEVVRQYLDKVLTKMGHSVELVSDGEEALKRVKATRYSLILTDIKMPGMDGKEFYRRVGEIAASITKRVVFITGDVMGEDTRDFMLKTGAIYVTKPFDVGRLSWVVNKVLGGSKA